MKKSVPLLPFALSAAIVAADQVSKALIVATVAPDSIAYRGQGDILWIVRQQNMGMAFSLLDRLAPGPRAVVLVALPLILVLAVLIFYFKSREPNLLQRWALCGIVGGGLGNVLDRALRPNGVVDFISVKFYGLFGLERWPTFNIADASVVVSAIVLVLTTIALDIRRNK